jgi:8-oxo-dGTP pyrophosphatase MutT (NUDIX family)
LNLREFFEKKDYRPTGIGLLKNKDGEYLFLRSGKAAKYGNITNVWCFPQGGIEENEDLEEGLIREIKEEIGLKESDISVGKLIGKFYVDINGRKNFKRFKKGKVYFVFSVEAKSKDIKLFEEEVLDYKWIPKEKLRDFLRNSNQSEEKIEALMQVIRGVE